MPIPWWRPQAVAWAVCAAALLAPAGARRGGDDRQRSRVEPDADADVFGNESQDACPGVPGPRGGSPATAVRPDTSITGAPAKEVKGRRATIAFASTDPTASFECALDGGGFKPCGSPLNLKRLRPGKHRVGVRAISGAGLVDESPAVARFKVGKRRR